MVTGRRGSASTIAGISAGLAVVIAALAFIGSLAHLLDQPALLGMGWDVIAREGYTTVDATRVRAAAEGEPSLQRISGLGYIDGELNGVKTPVAAVRSLLGAPWPPIVAGRAPASTSEILVGRTTLRSLHLRVGEQVHVALDRIGDGGGSRPGSESRTFTIVGSAVNPAISLEGSESPRLDRGALLLQDAYDEMFGTPMTSDIVLFDLADHRSASSLIARFPEGLPDQNDIPTEWFTSAVPAEVSQAQESRSVIGLAVASLSLAIVATVAHTLLGFVRQRRRDFAVLKALGFTRGQIRTTVLIQSGALLFVGLIAALPLGVAAGRWLWAGFAERIGVVVVPVVPMLLIVGATLLSILTVQGAALIPATLARRTQPGRTLHGE